jgi:hypothetical protein
MTFKMGSAGLGAEAAFVAAELVAEVAARNGVKESCKAKAPQVAMRKNSKH